MKDILLMAGYVILTCAIIYGLYWVLKNGSYFFFYESMVQETIREMVSPEYLNN